MIRIPKRLMRLIFGGIAAALLLLLFFFLICPLANDGAAKRNLRKVEALPLPEGAEKLESYSASGHLLGRGNGMQYLGLILLRSAQSEEELKLYYAALSKTGEQYNVAAQTGRELAILPGRKHHFKTDISGGDCYIVYLWGGRNGIFEVLDPR